MLITRCPHCATVFELSSAQLRMRGGLVRCGECARVFDARASLIEPPIHGEATREATRDATRGIIRAETQLALRVTHAPPETSRPLAAPAVLRHRTDRLAPGLNRQTENHGDDTATDTDDDGDDYHDDDDSSDDARTDTPVDTPAPVIIAEPNPYVHARAVPEFMDDGSDADTPRPWARRLWPLAALLALLLLTVQSVVTFRVAVATAAPVLRPTLEALCRPLDCVVGYERRAERLAITASSLQPAGTHTEDGAVRLVLAVTLRNRYLHPQSWPALMLELRDFSDTVVVRRAVLPDEYLSPTMAAQPLGAGAEVALSIALTVTDVPVSGYQVRAFYP